MKLSCSLQYELKWEPKIQNVDEHHREKSRKIFAFLYACMHACLRLNRYGMPLLY